MPGAQRAMARVGEVSFHFLPIFQCWVDRFAFPLLTWLNFCYFPRINGSPLILE